MHVHFNKLHIKEVCSKFFKVDVDIQVPIV